MDHMFHSDVWMHILSYVNVVDACNSLLFVSKRFFYLASQYQEILAQPQLAAAATPEECLRKLTHKPTLVLGFQGADGADRIPRHVPDNAVVLGARTTDVQSNIAGNVTTDNSILMASFGPDTVVTPFFNELPEDEEDYQVMIVYVCGQGYYAAESFLSEFQSQHPTATIVGGICEGGYVSDFSTLRGIRHVNSGIFGILGRNMPLQSVVSRGVKSLTENSTWRVQQACLVTPDDEEYIFVGHEDPYHSITKICNEETGTITPPTAMLHRYRPDFCGLQREGTGGFELNVLNPISLQTNSIILMTDGSPEQTQSLENAQLDFFSLDGEECKKHLDWTLQQLKKQTQDETILGAVMFSCSGRGPDARSLLRESMADATRFHKHFPETPCCGFYAGGEIGPMALARCHDNVFQRGKAAVQGFTAVFALFIVPVAQPRTYELDDSDENVALFVRNRLGILDEMEE